MSKIDIISGFLGAGKTTLIKKLVKESLKNEQVVLIENEFGEIGIDSGFLKDAGIEIKEMNSGCICCSLVGDFGASLKEVISKYHPDRILIEPSGVGKLSDVIKAVEGVMEETGVVLNSSTTVVDAGKCKMYLKNFGEFFTNQISYAGTIILSRTNKISEEKLEKCVSMIREYNEKATIITTPWEDLSGVQMLAVMEHSSDFEAEMLKEVVKEHAHNEEHGHGNECGCGCHSHDTHEHHHRHNENEHGAECACGCHDHEHHHADEIFKSFGLETPKKYTKQKVTNILEALEDKDSYGFVLRAKGIVASEEKDFIYFDYVPAESNIRTGIPEYTGKICVIGSGLKEDNLKQLFSE